jgi:endonuclease III
MTEDIIKDLKIQIDHLESEVLRWQQFGNKTLEDFEKSTREFVETVGLLSKKQKEVDGLLKIINAQSEKMIEMSVIMDELAKIAGVEIEISNITIQ